MYLTDVWNLSYKEYVQHLLKKYGPAEHDYFDDKGNFTASRTWSDGLECHHIDEDKIPNLSDDYAYLTYPQYQKADRLVYCNRIEHLILHIKIAQIPIDDSSKRQITYFNSGVELLIRRLNDGYSGYLTEYDWNSRVHFRIRNWSFLYLQVLKLLVKDMKNEGYTDNQIEKLIYAHNYGFPKKIKAMYKNVKISEYVVI